MQQELRINIDEIELDPANPRIKQFVAMYPNLTKERMLLALGGGSDYQDDDIAQGASGSYGRLKQSIRASGGIIQSIIVKPTGSNSYLCVEGNTRVAIYRELREEEQKLGGTGNRWNTIPAIVQNDMDEMEAHKVRLQVHLVGNRQWNPYSKGKYLYELVETQKLAISELIELCGGDAADIHQSIDAYRDMEQHYRPQLEDDSDFDPQRFSAFRELQRPKIKEALYDHDFTETDFAKWVIDQKINPLNTVRDLPKILAKPEAKRTFLRADAREARKMLDAPSLDAHLREASLTQLAQAMLEKIHKLDLEDEEGIRTNQETEYACLSDLCVELSNIVKYPDVG